MYNCTKCGRDIEAPKDLTVRAVRCQCGNMVSFSDALTMVPQSSSVNLWDKLLVNSNDNNVFQALSQVSKPANSDVISIPGYRIVRKIGEGGMGSVFEAVQESLGRSVAIKILPGKLASDTQFVKRFEREAGTLSQLRHPNIGGIIDRGSVNGTYYFVMEYVVDKNGNILTLQELINQRKLDGNSVLKFTREIAGALAYAHSKGIIHRDIKPSNILIDEHSAARVVDFGIAHIMGDEQNRRLQLTMTGESIGTPQYMSPEQKTDATKADARSDIYSFGIMVYEMLTGGFPEGAWDLPSELGCDPKWDSIVENSIRKLPERRFQKMTDFLSSLNVFETVAPMPKEVTASTDKVKEEHYRTPVPSLILGKCPACGVDNPGDNKFCNGCGASLYEACPACQGDIRVGLKFCGKCGIDIPKQKKINELKEAISKALEATSSKKDDIVEATEILLKSVALDYSLANISDTGSGSIQPLPVHAALNSLWDKNALTSEIFPSSGIKHIRFLKQVSLELPERKDIQFKIEELSSERDNLLKELKTLFKDGHFLTLMQMASKSRWDEYAEISSIVDDAQERFTKANELKEAISKALEAASSKKSEIVAATKILLDALKLDDTLVNISGIASGSIQPQAVHAALNSLWNEKALTSEIFPSSGIKHIELLKQLSQELPDRKDIQFKIEELSSERDNLLKELKSLFSEGHFLTLMQTASKSKWGEYLEIASIVTNAQERFGKATNLVDLKIPELIAMKWYFELNKVLAELEGIGAAVEGLSELRKETDLTLSESKQMYEKAVKLNSANKLIECRAELEKLLDLCSDYPWASKWLEENNREISKYMKSIAEAKILISRKEFRKAVEHLNPLSSRYDSDEVKTLLAEAVKGAEKAFRRKLRFAAIALPSVISIITIITFAINNHSNYKEYSSYCKTANIAFSEKEYEKTIKLYNAALKIHGYHNNTSAKNLLQEAMLALERKIQFDKLMVDGKQSIGKSDWESAKMAFNTAVKVAGYENDSEARNNLKKCEDYLAEKRRKNKDDFNNAIFEGAKELSYKEYEKALKLSEDALKIPGYEKNEFATRQRDFVKLMLEGRTAIDKKDWINAENKLKDALAIPGYEKNSIAVAFLKAAKESPEIQKQGEAIWNETETKVNKLLSDANNNSLNIERRIESADSAMVLLQKIPESLDMTYLSDLSKTKIFNLKNETASLKLKLSLMMIPIGFEVVAGSLSDTNGLPLCIRHKTTGIEMVYVAPGEFMMGSPANEAERSSDETQHKVKLTKGYYIGKYEVTQQQYEIVTGSNPSNFKASGKDAPVETMSWDDCQAFCRKLGSGFRLPTEAEWEYAARGGNRSKGYIYSGSNNLDEVAWYDKNSGNKTQSVGQKKPNELGIYDMSGNVWEWCADWYGEYPSGSVTDPTGATTGSYRVLRGGSWGYGYRDCRTARRSCGVPVGRGYDFGIRVVFSVR